MTRLIIIIFFLIGCEKEDKLILSKNTFSIKIDSVLNSSGTKSLLFDANGFYHLKLDATKNQTLSRVTGTILLNGKEPIPQEKVDWESNLYWSVKRGESFT